MESAQIDVLAYASSASVYSQNGAGKENDDHDRELFHSPLEINATYVAVGMCASF
jgi:hypothetical protein